MGLAREPTGEGLRREPGCLVEMVVTATTDGG
jgi:hypothetical protein